MNFAASPGRGRPMMVGRTSASRQEAMGMDIGGNRLQHGDGRREQTMLDKRRLAAEKEMLMDTRHKQEKEYLEMLRMREASLNAHEYSPKDKRKGSSLKKIFGFGF
eukprot:TRINITY_DN29735_c0_g1_i1.p2 TRINITY_DN29735_c0_g1~~TRINITY_DN29735_c0_g1_i1.p2  ORF type:complete len:106 (-),score=8.70 TRINITY_DN29735_c0_g1_i1:138-455(-)